MTVPPPIVLYIAGYGRSGSTILEMALGLGDGVRGVGEVAHLFREMGAGSTCTCGQPLVECGAWAEVRKRLAGIDPAEMAAATRRVESRLTLLRPLPASDPRVVLYARAWRTVFEALADGHAQVIADSSKSAGAAARPLALSRYCGLDVRVIHLVRDPRAVVWSVLRGSNRRMMAGERPQQRWGTTRALLGWVAANTCADRARRLGGLPGTRLRYEDFVQDPVGEMDRLGNELGVDLSTAAARLAGDYFLEPGHGVAGNRVRAAGVRSLRLDQEWREHLPRRARLLARLSGPLARRYRYATSD